MTTPRRDLALDLDAVRARADAATDGPWFAHDGNLDYDPRPFWVVSQEDAQDDSVAEVHVGCREDAEFIAHAREDVPALLAELARVTGERDDALAAAPTRWAYDQACKALERHRQRADEVERERDRLRGERDDALTTIRALVGHPEAAEPMWLVWSVYYDAWWGPGGCGYFSNLLRAGRYTREDAERVCANGGSKGFSATGQPSEVMVPVHAAIGVLATGQQVVAEIRAQVAAAIEQATQRQPSGTEAG